MQTSYISASSNKRERKQTQNDVCTLFYGKKIFDAGKKGNSN